MDKLLTIDEVAHYLNVEKKETIYQWVHKRVIPFIKINGKLRFSEQDIEKWIKNNTFHTEEHSTIKETDNIFDKMHH